MVDANAILSSVDNDCRKGAALAVPAAADDQRRHRRPVRPRPHLLRGVPAAAQDRPVQPGAAKCAPRKVRGQVPARAAVRQVDTAAIADPQVLAITDPDDVPTGQLAKLIAPCVVFSEDRHLRKPGLAPTAWRDAAQFAVDLAAGVTGQRITGNLATLPFRGGAGLLAFLSRKTGISPWIIGGITAVAAAYVFSSPQRRHTVGRYVVPVAEALVEEMERSAALEQHGIAGLREILLAALPEPDVKQQAAIVLARSDEPLLAREVQQRALRLFPGDRVPAVTELRTALRDGPEFVQPERYRWQFCREAGPWRGRYREPV